MIRNVPSSTRAHPRSRGENPGSVLRLGLGKGSSPLTRGKPHRVRGLQARVGLIPAHAGKTSDVDIAAGSCWAHPRSRGENDLPRADRALGRGSSPLTRGKRRLVRRGLRRRRLIPAHAGKTATGRGSNARHGAHPRSRGENRVFPVGYVSVSGSSPLTRGKRQGGVEDQQANRLIPAHAGKTCISARVSSARPAHPRSRGENGPYETAAPAMTGSSPLTRGKRCGRPLCVCRGGLIPAHAGKTCRLTEWPSARRAHPRSRGENRSCGSPTYSSRGSSPLTRGKLRAVVGGRPGGGLIPAHAGKTGRPWYQYSCTRAHPRSRGENSPSAHGRPN